MLCETQKAVVDTPEILQQAWKERRKEYLKGYFKVYNKTEKRNAYNRSWREANKEHILANKERKKATNRSFYNANADKIKAHARTYYAANIEKKKAHNRSWREANADKITAYNQTYYAANIDKITAYNQTYYAANIDKITQYKREKYGCVDCKDWPDWQYGSKRYDGRCPRCHEHKFPDDPRLRAEDTVKAYINANFKDFVHNHTMPTEHCVCDHLRRIDHRCVVGNTLFCIETDEHYHRYYDPDDEDARYHDGMLPWGGKLCLSASTPTDSAPTTRARRSRSGWSACIRR
jgi:hypothetical protein